MGLENDDCIFEEVEGEGDICILYCFLFLDLRIPRDGSMLGRLRPAMKTKMKGGVH